MIETNSMNTVTKSIGPADLDTEQWQRQVISTQLAPFNANVLAYQGEVVTAAQPRLRHSIEFNLQTSPIRKAIIEMTLWVSAEATVTVNINGAVVKQVPLQGSTEELPLAHRISVQVTNWIEAAANAKLRLDISYLNLAGITTIVTEPGQSELSPLLVQPWSASYSTQSILFRICLPDQSSPREPGDGGSARHSNC